MHFDCIARGKATFASQSSDNSQSTAHYFIPYDRVARYDETQQQHRMDI